MSSIAPITVLTDASIMTPQSNEVSPHQETIIDVVQKLSLAKDIETIMFIVRKAARHFTASDGATFVLKKGDECFYAAEDAIAPLWQGKRFPMSICVSGWVMNNKKSVIIEDIFSDDRVPQEAYRPTFVKSLAMVPIRSADPIGAIGVYWAEPFRPSVEQMNLLKSLADSTSVAMENIRLQSELEAGNKENLTQIEMTEKLIEANKKLETSLIELNHRQQEMQWLKDLSSRLQTCIAIDEAYQIVAQYLTQLLPGVSGQLYLMHASRNYLESMVDWGTVANKVTILKPDDCLALRSGSVHIIDKPAQQILCKHYPHAAHDKTYTCMPLYAQSDILGLLCLEWPFNTEDAVAKSNQYILASMIAEQIAIGLANIKLRETLRNQSVRDTLTGLYNRRYIEECLDREVGRCNRNQTTLALVMIDIDHFKRFNDEYGHGAGDAVIVQIAQTMGSSVRNGSDIASRFGGEEFLLALPEISLEDAYNRVENLRKTIAEHPLEYHGTKLPQITISLGLALYPLHGDKINHIIEAADMALYQAKNSGRNKTVIYQKEMK